MKNLKRLIVLIIFLFINMSCFCQNATAKDTICFYDFEILYGFQGNEIISDKYRNRLSPDTLYIIIESGFSSDFISINSDKGRIFEDKVLTEPSSGVAQTILARNNDGIANLSVSINYKPKVTFDLLTKEFNIIGIRKHNNKVIIVFYKKVPVFY